MDKEQKISSVKVENGIDLSKHKNEKLEAELQEALIHDAIWVTFFAQNQGLIENIEKYKLLSPETDKHIVNLFRKIEVAIEFLHEIDRYAALYDT